MPLKVTNACEVVQTTNGTGIYHLIIVSIPLWLTGGEQGTVGSLSGSRLGICCYGNSTLQLWDNVKGGGRWSYKEKTRREEGEGRRERGGGREEEGRREEGGREGGGRGGG